MSTEQITNFKSIVDKSSRIVGFTGAGISTESGIPDYRSKGGIWEQFQPVYFDEFISDESKRLLYWQRKQEQWGGISSAKPNPGHMFFKELYDSGKLSGLITQNIDGLHEKSGIPRDIIINLHGTTLDVICLECGCIISSEEIFADMDLDSGVPLCRECNGLLKPNTISFGQQLNAEDIRKAGEMVTDCDLMIIMGSTLIVQPAASFPVAAKQNGAMVALVNLSETPLDDLADFVFNTKIGEFVDLYAGTE
ncbi:NAD-dependent deacetylase [Elusimicrobiota bacterium]